MMMSRKRMRARPTQKKIVALVVDAIHPHSKGGREIRYHEYAKHLPDGVELHILRCAGGMERESR